MKINISEREVMDPLAESGGEKIALKDIPPVIPKISIFDNTKPHADTILKVLSSHLRDFEIINAQKPAGAAASHSQLEKAAQGDVSILALGDCGSCTTWVILDAIKLEKEGVPTISICSDKFAPFARKLAQAHGTEDLRIIKVSHPIAGRSKEEVEEKTLKIIPEIKKILRID
jgi:hypothetical protein